MPVRELRFTSHALVRMRKRAIHRSDVQHVWENGTITKDPSWKADEPVHRATGVVPRNGARLRIVFRRTMGEDVVITAMKLRR